MIKYIPAFAIKLIFTTVVIFSLFSIFYHLSMTELLFIVFLVSGLTFIVDLFLFARFGYLITPIIEFVSTFALLIFLSSIFVQTGVSSIVISFAAAYLIAICEALYHIYLGENVMDKDEPIIRQLQVELAEEIEPHIKREE
ncbi:DUF2512 family protein [Ornithinibacillus sp. 4-3]|uniref:DUF2512 family protein n=1 Tax=Ornithinibacillus sp. 4-3 TaxID=3231488 RepID=A0AB39HN09_9BACI